MKPLKDDDYEKDNSTVFGANGSIEHKPGKSEPSYEAGTQPSRSHRVDWAASDRKRFGLCPCTTETGSSN